MFGFMPAEESRMFKSAAHVTRRSPHPISGPKALSALAALGQPTRLDIVRLLMRHEPDGLSAGAIAAQLDCRHNTLSTHLAILVRADLVRGTRAGRAIIYRADIAGMRRMISYLVTDCCDGHPDLCDFASGSGRPSRGCGRRASPPSDGSRP
jgi:ArsR family transcriptional regulator